MQKNYLKICNPKGLHARAAAKLSSKVADYQSHILIRYGNKTVEANSVIQLMLLASPFGCEIELIVEGDDEIIAFKGISELINSGFEENQ